MHGIKNFSRTDRPSGFAGFPAGFGGATPDSAMDWLKAEGFASVINLRVANEEGVDLEASRAAAAAAGLEYVHLPSRQVPSAEVVDLSVTGKGDFEGVTLVAAEAVAAGLDRVLAAGKEFGIPVALNGTADMARRVEQGARMFVSIGFRSQPPTEEQRAAVGR